MDHETVVRGVAQDIQMDSCIDDLSSIASKGLSHHDCGRPFHVDSTSGSMHQQHTPGQAEEEREKKKTGERGQSEEVEKGREERESVRKGGRGKEEGGDAEEEECKQVKKDVTGWTVVTRNKRQRKIVQISVKVDEAKVTPVRLTDGKVEDVMRQAQKDEDVHVTTHGRVLRRNEKLKSCGVTDGCTIQVTSRMR